MKKYMKKLMMLLGLMPLALTGCYDDYTMDYDYNAVYVACLLYTSPSPRDKRQSRIPSSA